MIDALLAGTFRALEAVVLALLRFGPQKQRALMAALLSSACLLGAFDLSVSMDAAAFRPARRAALHPPIAVEPEARAAIELVQDWLMAGEELTVLQRLGRIDRYPTRVRAWSAEQTGEDAYLVIYREPAGFPAYAFEADLVSGRVLPTPEAVDLFTQMRLREETAAQTSLVASLR